MIRIAEHFDKQKVRDLQQSCLPDYTYTSYANNIGATRCLNLVDVEGDAVVGFVSVLMDAADPGRADVWARLGPYVGFVGVLSNFRRSGRCRHLIDHACVLLKDRGVEGPLYLECSHDLVALYQRAGFNVIGRLSVRRLIGLKPKQVVMFKDY